MMPTNLSTRSRDEHPVHYLVVALHKLGVSEGDICERLQLDKTRLFDPDAVSSAENYLNLFEWAARQLGDASLGLHITEVAEPRQFGLLGYLVDNAATVRDMCLFLDHYYQTFTGYFDLTFSMNGGMCSFRYLADSFPGNETRQDVDLTLGMLVRAFRKKLGPDWRPKSCSFTFPKPQDLTVYRRIFGADIRFDQTENRLTFAASTLRQEIHGSDPGLLVILRNQADAILAQPWSDQSLARKVRLILSSRIGQAEMRAELMAEHLNMSATNLRRRLNDEETSFRRLRLDVLQAAAREALELTDKSVLEISEDLGYAEISAFNRAFKREEGISPLQFRKRAIS